MTARSAASRDWRAAGRNAAPAGVSPHPAGGALEQLRPQLLLQTSDLVTEGGLHDQTALGGTGEAVRLGNGDHVAHLLQVHVIHLVSR